MADGEKRNLTHNGGAPQPPRPKPRLELVWLNDHALARADVVLDRFRFDLYPK